MNSTIWVAFITGLTAGGLSCLAVQGGLLSGAIAHEVEQDVIASQTILVGKKGKKAQPQPVRRSARIARPILLFLAAKLVAYTLLGFLLGLLGQVLYLSALTRGILQIAIGVFMVGNGLRMLNVHPIFRYFNLQPPSFITRYIRRKSKNSEGLVTPISLGLLTVLIPCGITQSMMALAMGLGSPVLGAMTMFAFVLGTSPLFFGVTYLATKLGSLTEKYFLRLVAAVLIILGLLTTNTGLNLVGSPLSFNRLTSRIFPSTSPAVVESTPGVPQTLAGVFGSTPEGPQKQSTVDSPLPAGAQTLTVNVKNNGYFPGTLQAPAGQSVEVHFVTQNTQSCSRALVIPSLRIEKVLPASGDTVITIPPQPKGSTLQYTCSMGMYTGVIQFN